MKRQSFHIPIPDWIAATQIRAQFVDLSPSTIQRFATREGAIPANPRASEPDPPQRTNRRKKINPGAQDDQFSLNL